MCVCHRSRRLEKTLGTLLLSAKRMPSYAVLRCGLCSHHSEQMVRSLAASVTVSGRQAGAQGVVLSHEAPHRSFRACDTGFNCGALLPLLNPSAAGRTARRQSGAASATATAFVYLRVHAVEAVEAVETVEAVEAVLPVQPVQPEQAHDAWLVRTSRRQSRPTYTAAASAPPRP